MRSLSIQLIALVATVAIVLITPIEVEARSRRRGRGRSSTAAAAAMRQAMIQRATAQKAAAQQVLAAAEYKGANAQAKLSVSLGKLQETAGEFRQAHETEHGLAKDLAEIQNEILDEQSAGSAYALAQLEVASARRELEAIKSRILSQPEVSAKLAGQQGVALTNLTSAELVTHLDYAAAKSRLDTAAAEIDRIRRELFRADEDWQQTADALMQAKQDIQTAEQEAKASGLTRLGPLQDYRKASDAAAAARAVIAQAEGTLRSLNSAGKSKSSTNRK
jgi:hypothetical protein